MVLPSRARQCGRLPWFPAGIFIANLSKGRMEPANPTFPAHMSGNPVTASHVETSSPIETSLVNDAAKHFSPP